MMGIQQQLVLLRLQVRYQFLVMRLYHAILAKMVWWLAERIVEYIGRVLAALFRRYVAPALKHMSRSVRRYFAAVNETVETFRSLTIIDGRTGEVVFG